MSIYAASMTPTSCGISTLGLNRVMLGQFYRGGRVVVLECFAHEWKCFMPQLPSLALASCDHSRLRTGALSSLGRLEHDRKSWHVK